MMPSYNRNILIRCIGCRLPVNLCLCAQIPMIQMNTRIVLVMQRKEWKVISNTGFLVPKIFKNTVMRFRGHESRAPLFLDDLVDSSCLLLYPSKESVVLDSSFVESLPKPLTLFVLDGNWSQALKMSRKEEVFKKMTHVKLPLGNPSQYQLRTNQRPGCVCTLEAIARSLGVIEGEEIQKKIEDFFNEWVTRWLYVRGNLSKEDYLEKKTLSASS